MLEAIADRIFPATDTPGAVEIGAVAYIDQALAGDYTMYRSAYRRGLKALNRYARQKFGANFTALREERKDSLLEDLEMGHAARFPQSVEFFEMVRCHVLEGVFGEPDYGGNRGLIGWRLVGFPGQQFGYADAYINKLVDLSPLATPKGQAEDE
jgi:gluconate 2-dehydrogenase gamma chain